MSTTAPQDVQQLFFESSMDLFCFADHSGYFQVLNPAWEKTLGRPLRELRAKPYEEFIHPDDRGPTHEAAERLANGEEVVAFRNRYRHKEGHYIWLQWNASASEDGHVFATARDITADVEREQGRARLLNNITHDMVSPLTSINLQLDLLERSEADLNAQTLQGLRLIRRNVRQLIELAEDAKTVGRLEEDQFPIRLEPVDMRDIALDAVESLETTARTDNITVRLEDRGEVRLQADPQRLKQVFRNLIHNAIRFSPEGSTVTISCKQTQDGASAEIRDEGPGLEPEEMARLFLPFPRVRAMAGQREGGTGLGLYICKQIVERHGGRITVASEGHGTGSRFMVVIPQDTIGST